MAAPNSHELKSRLSVKICREDVPNSWKYY